MKKLLETPYKSRPLFLNDREFALCDRVNGARVYDVMHPLTPTLYFPDYIVHFVMRDMEQNLWFATKGTGVFKISSNHFKNLFTVNEKGTTYIRDIHKIGQYIYVGGFNNKFWKLKPVNDDFFRGDISGKPVPFHINDAVFDHITAPILVHTGSSDFFTPPRLRSDSLSYPQDDPGCQ